MENVYSFTAAVRGFHYYIKFWKSKENEKLDCSHKEHNPFDWFAIKTVISDEMIVGHLPREISRITKFFLNGGAVMQAELTSKDYRRSQLVKSGMEIACSVRARIPMTLKNTNLSEKYLELARDRYTKPKNEESLGCFVTNTGTDMGKKSKLLYGKKIKEKEEKFLKVNRHKSNAWSYCSSIIQQKTTESSWSYWNRWTTKFLWNLFKIWTSLTKFVVWNN